MAGPSQWPKRARSSRSVPHDPRRERLQLASGGAMLTNAQKVAALEAAAIAHDRASEYLKEAERYSRTPYSVTKDARDTEAALRGALDVAREAVLTALDRADAD